MTVAELIKSLQKLPPDAEVGLLAASGFARPPQVERVITDAGWRCNNHARHLAKCGFKNPDRAFLIRPMQDVV